MKRFLQIVALAVVASLAAQPALAGVTCAMGAPAMAPCAPDCGMSMSQMGMDCQMPIQIAGTGCEMNCCHNAFLQGIVPSASGLRQKILRTAHFELVPLTVTDPVTVIVAAPPGGITASASARYILFQVFRI
ncbi:MAG: hypothetical protein ABSF16_08020 [Terracidiphilus sp.]